MADDITRHRAAIDALDEKIAALLNERANHAASIGKLKANGGAYRPEREAEILRRIAAANRGPLANDALDLLLATPLKICAEVVLRVQQNLMAKRPSMKAIRKVYSHPQSLAQCHGWLSQNLPGARRVPLASNAEAARVAAKEAGAAAIGPEIAAARYGLRLLARSIEDDPKNRTRFLVLGSHDAGSSGKDRT